MTTFKSDIVLSINQIKVGNPKRYRVKCSCYICFSLKNDVVFPSVSLFKPYKINFTNAAPIVDTQTVQYSYQVPSQNLSFSYRPIALNPLAIVLTSPANLAGNTNVKVGFGNYLYQLLQFFYYFDHIYF